MAVVVPHSIKEISIGFKIDPTEEQKCLECNMASIQMWLSKLAQESMPILKEEIRALDIEEERYIKFTLNIDVVDYETD